MGPLIFNSGGDERGINERDMTTLQPIAASALTASVRRLSCGIRHGATACNLSNGRVRRLQTGVFRRGFIVSISAAAAATEPVEVCVKASITKPNRLGDCPFCQRVLLTLEEKHLPYEMKLVDLANKPDWFLTLSPEGKVPVAKLDGIWTADSDVITQALEVKFPTPPLIAPPEKATIGSKIFSTFIGFLKSKDPSDGTEQALLNELTSFDSYIKQNGPFINGRTISAVDLSLGPKLYHMDIALSHYKNWTVPDSLPNMKSYMKTIFTLDSFIKTKATPEDVIAGWRPKVLG